MRVATHDDYDDYNEYADFLAAFLYDKMNYTFPQEQLYMWIQEFNKELGKNG